MQGEYLNMLNQFSRTQLLLGQEVMERLFKPIAKAFYVA